MPSWKDTDDIGSIQSFPVRAMFLNEIQSIQRITCQPYVYFLNGKPGHFMTPDVQLTSENSSGEVGWTHYLWDG